MAEFSSARLRDGRNTRTVESLKSDAPDAQGQTVFLNCGRRALKISVAKVEGHKEDASVSEVLEKRLILPNIAVADGEGLFHQAAHAGRFLL